MGSLISRFLLGVRPLVIAAIIACLSPAAQAQEGAADIVSAETLTLYGDLRVTAVDGEPSWVEGGWAKLRYGGSADPASSRASATVGEVGIAWQPRLSWSLSATVVALAQGGQTFDGSIEAGLSEAYLSFKPLTDGPVKVSVRAGLMWPPVSIEHTGPEWAVSDTLTPSAIGSWMGEEVKVLGLEFSARRRLANSELSLTAGLFDYNDTAGALLAFRGWALHDRKALAFRKQPLPPLNSFMQLVQPPYTHPLIDFESSVLKRPGYYAKLAWTAPVPVHFEAVRYDNNGNPEAFNADLEWGWRTQFNSVGVIADLGRGRELRTQGLSGRTRMGYPMGGRDWIDARFNAAFGMLTQELGQASASARFDIFSTRNRGSALDTLDDEDGWALTLGGKRAMGKLFTAFVEYLHVESDKGARERSSLGAKQVQNQVQLALRARW